MGWFFPPGGFPLIGGGGGGERAGARGLGGARGVSCREMCIDSSQVLFQSPAQTRC